VKLKSDRDIAFLRRSADLVSRTLGEVAKAVGEGVTLVELDEIADAFIRENGARPAFRGYDPGWGGGAFPGSVCSSVNDVVVHGFPTDYALQSGDIVTIDIGVELDGYFGDSGYTFSVGDVAHDVLDLMATTYESLMLGVAQAVHGKRVGAISHAVQTHCESRGYGVVRDLVGHGIGTSLHESPQVPNFGAIKSGAKMKRGLTICIEPMIGLESGETTTDDDQWTVRTADRKPAAHYEHMVVVQKDEPLVLTTFDYIHDVRPAAFTPAREELV
jgi:methionyl aminopeptidase